MHTPYKSRYSVNFKGDERECVHGAFCYPSGMTIEPWRQRLREAVMKDGRAWSVISKRADIGGNFVEHFMKEEQRTSVEKALKLCKEVGADPAYIFGDVQVTPDLRRFLEMARHWDEDRIRALIQTLDPR